MNSTALTPSQELQQHDVQELNRILFTAIESSLAGTSGEQLIARLYHGTSVSRVICQKCGRVSRREVGGYLSASSGVHVTLTRLWQYAWRVC